MSIALVIHGHFYQPPRENPWTDHIDREATAAPFHDWNARIHAECYRANAFARIHDGSGRIESIVNNYGRLSFNFGPTLARWIEGNDATVHDRLVVADGEQRRRSGAGGAMAQAYAHPILPLCAPHDRRTQVLWGLADFRRRFGRPAQGLWMPETAANADTLETLIETGVQYTIVAPEQVAAVRAPRNERENTPGEEDEDEDWTSVDRDTVDTGRAYRWFHRDGSGRFLTVAVFDGPLSRGVAFGDATRDAATFMAAARASAARSRVTGEPLVLCASDGELFGHHKKFADLNLAFSTFVEAPRQGITIMNLGAYLREHPATWEMALAEGPDGRGTSWSCAHGVGRWWRDCGCTMVAPEREWNQRWRSPLREALDLLQGEAATFFEDAASELLLDPWGARDAYGEVVDAPIVKRDQLLATFGTRALATGGSGAADRARLLMEIQRSSLLMFASCGWYFDDIAGLEAGLVLRMAAHTADLMKAAGGSPPVTRMLEILADGKINPAEPVTVATGGGVASQPKSKGQSESGLKAAAPANRGDAAEFESPRESAGEPELKSELESSAVNGFAETSPAAPVAPEGASSQAGTGADVFARGAADRFTPAHAVAAVGLALTASPHALPAFPVPGFTVEVLSRGGGRGGALAGRARVTNDRTGAARSAVFSAGWELGRGFRVTVDGVEIALSDLGRECRHRLLPLLLPRLVADPAAARAARTALQLGAEVVGLGDGADDVAARQAYADLLMRVLTEGPPLTAATIDLAVKLVDAAGAAVAPGTRARATTEEIVAQLLDRPVSKLAERRDLMRLAERIGFAPPVITALS